MRYVPKRRLRFNYLAGDGKMCLVFNAGENNKHSTATWKVTLMTSLPAAMYAFQMLGPEFWFCYPMMLSPSLYYFMQARKTNLKV